MASNAHGAQIMSAREMLERRREFLRRLEESEPHPGRDRLIREVRSSITLLEMRAAREEAATDGGEG